MRPVAAATETQFAGHLQPGEADVDAVYVRDDVQEEQKRHQVPCHMAPRAFGEISTDHSRVSHAEKHITRKRRLRRQ